MLSGPVSRSSRYTGAARRGQRGRRGRDSESAFDSGVCASLAYSAPALSQLSDGDALYPLNYPLKEPLVDLPTIPRPHPSPHKKTGNSFGKRARTGVAICCKNSVIAVKHTHKHQTILCNSCYLHLERPRRKSLSCSERGPK